MPETRQPTATPVTLTRTVEPAARTPRSARPTDRLPFVLSNSASSLAARGPVTECHGVQLRAQLRSVAVLVEVTGHLGAANRTLVTNKVRRFAMVGGELVLDLREAGGVDDAFVRDLSPVANLTLVLDPVRRETLASHGLRVVGSVGDAMRGIAGRLTARRALVELSV